MNEKYIFYGHETPSVSPIKNEYAAIKDQRALYDLLKKVWCEYTCTPRLRDKWSKENPTVGQCAITAFLAQDIFGGDVLAVPTADGGKHCFNRVDGVIFDLTSEQFLPAVPDYSSPTVQSRAEHFERREKYERYLYLSKKLKETLAKT